MKQMRLDQLWCDHEWSQFQQNTKFIEVDHDKGLYEKTVTNKYKCKKCYAMKEEIGE